MIYMDVDAALSEVPVNTVPLMDDTDFKTVEEGVAYNASGMELIWHFVTSAGAYTATVVTPTTGGAYDWAHQDGGMYSIEIPASGGASANNDTEGYGWFTGKATGVLPWRGPTIGFRAAALNNALCDGGDTLDVNVTEIAGSSAPATNLGHAANCIAYGTAGASCTTTSVTTSALSPSGIDSGQFVGLIMKFENTTTTTGLRGEGRPITGFDAGTDTFTTEAFSTAPASGDIFVIN